MKNDYEGYKINWDHELLYNLIEPKMESLQGSAGTTLGILQL